MRRAGAASSSRPWRGAARCAAIAAVATVAGCAPRSADEPPDHPRPVTQAAIRLTGGDTPPADDAAWTPVTLPDDWSRTRPQQGGDAWYRVEFDVRPDAVSLTAIYVPRVNMVATPFVNGSRIAEGGRFSEPMTRLWYRPQLYWVPQALLRAGPNLLHYRIRCYPGSQGGVSEIYIGAPAPVAALWRAHQFRQVTAMQATTGITAALGLLVLAAWAMLGRQSAYGYFGMATVFWTLHSTLVLTQDIPLPVLVWEVLIVASLMWVVAAMMMFALRFAGLRRPWLERAAWVYAVGGPFLLWVAGIAHVSAVANALLLILLVIGAYEFWILAEVARRARSVENLLIVGAGVFVLGLGTHDWLNRRGTFAYAEPFNMHYGVPVLFLAVFWNLLGQITAGRRAAETLNVALEARVREKAGELERSYERLRALDAAEALAVERERIMRDMHDGVGSQLLAARQLAARGALDTAALGRLLDECIDDLRLMIDSLEPTDGDLLTVLGNLRYRLTERLASQGVALRWSVGDLPPLPSLTPRDILHILRVVQEGVANVLKHAGATEIVFTTGLSPDGAQALISVRDNGRGMITRAQPARGRGLGNMRQRAAAVGGTLTVESAPTGCVVTLSLPVASDATASASGSDPIPERRGA